MRGICMRHLDNGIDVTREIHTRVNFPYDFVLTRQLLDLKTQAALLPLVPLVLPYWNSPRKCGYSFFLQLASHSRRTP